MRLFLFLLLTSIFPCSACSSLPTSSEVAGWKEQFGKSLATVSAGVEKVKAAGEVAAAKYEELKAQYEELKRKQAEILADVAAIAGPLDRDGDGDVTMGEAKATISELRKTPEGRSLLSSGEFWVAILGAVAGVGATAKAGPAVLRKLHATGRALVNKNGASS